MVMVFLGSMIVGIVIFMVEILIVHYNYQYHYHFPSDYPCPSPFFSHSFYLIYIVVVVSWWKTVLVRCGSGDSRDGQHGLGLRNHDGVGILSVSPWDPP